MAIPSLDRAQLNQILRCLPITIFACFATKARIAPIKCAPLKSNVPPSMEGGTLLFKGAHLIGAIRAFVAKQANIVIGKHLSI